MSCGNPHELDCRDALARLYEYIDGEVGPGDHDRIEHHLEECGPCWAEFDLEVLVKAVVARSCWDHAPRQLRSQVLARILAIGTAPADQPQA